jgi:pimeloyl-ACP methyl ester carboxylesterase
MACFGRNRADGRTERGGAVLITGDWVGVVAYGSQRAAVTCHLSTEANTGSPTGTMDIPLLWQSGLPLRDLQLSFRRVRFALHLTGEALTFHGRIRDDCVEGAVTSSKGTGTFALVRTDPDAASHYDAYAGSYRLDDGRMITIAKWEGELGWDHLAYLDVASGRVGGLLPRSATAFSGGPSLLAPWPIERRVTFSLDRTGSVTGLRWQEQGQAELVGHRLNFTHEPVTFENGDVVLRGTLTRPPTAGPHPALVLLHGSGPLHRSHSLFQFVTDLFAAAGVAVLAYDKRGVGESGGAWRTSRYEELGDDAHAGVELLTQHSDIDARRTGLWGISEGGWIAPYVAARSERVAFMVLVSAPAMSLWELQPVQVEARLRTDGLSEEQVVAAVKHERLLFAVLRGEVGWEEFATSVQNARNQPWVHAVHLYDAPEDLRFWLNHGDYDPKPYLAQVRCPVLALSGSRDWLTPPQENQHLLRRALADGLCPEAAIVMLPDTDHFLFASETGRLTDLLAGTRFAPGALDTMVEWIVRQAYALPVSSKNDPGQ